MGTRLFVGGLSWGTTDDSLRAAFESFGAVQEARVVLDRDTGRSRGFGFIRFAVEAEAKGAIEKMNGANLDGRTIRVNEADDRGPPGGPGGPGGRPGGPGGPGGGYGGDRRPPPRDGFTVERRGPPGGGGGYGGGGGGYGGGGGGGGGGYGGGGGGYGGGGGGGGDRRGPPSGGGYNGPPSGGGGYGAPRPGGPGGPRGPGGPGGGYGGPGGPRGPGGPGGPGGGFGGPRRPGGGFTRFDPALANTIPVPPPQDGFGDELEGRKRLPTKKKRKEPTEEERFAEGRGAQKTKKRESGRTWRDFTQDEDGGEEGAEAAEPAAPPADADGGDENE